MEYVVALVAELVQQSERNYEGRVERERLRDASNPFQVGDYRFKKLFRFPKMVALNIINSLHDARLDEGKIPKHIKVLTVLQFFAQGSYQTAVGQDSLLNISQSTVSRYISMVTDAIIKELTPNAIKFPTTTIEKERAKREFEDIYSMKNVLGAVDGTHVAISKPPINHPTAPGNLYYNRKGFYSINCQIICSAKGAILGINPNFPGSTHDAAIWRASKIYKHLRREYMSGIRDQWLLGDKGYPLEPWIMTPIIAPSTRAEESYNENHIRARNIVEMTIGRLKNKFRCLHRHRCLHYEPPKAAAIFITCCTLYNMYNNFFDDEETDDNENETVEDNAIAYNDEVIDNDFLTAARSIRQAYISNYFN